MGSTQSQSGECKGRKTLDLILTFKEEPKTWLDANDLPPGPCTIVARPTDNGDYEIRFSYLSEGGKRQWLEYLPFISTQMFIVDHWLSSDNPALAGKGKGGKDGKSGKEKVGALVQKMSESRAAKIESEMSDSFENQSSWEKILGSSATGLDFNSPELDRFRSHNVEKNVGISESPAERLPLKLPLLDLQPLDTALLFTPAKVNFSEFHLSAPEGKSDPKEERARDAAEDGLNLIRILAEKGQWAKAFKSIDIIERSKQAGYVPVRDPKWWALKGYIYLNLGAEMKDPNFLRKTIEIWRDGLRGTEGGAGDAQQYLEFMALESVRLLFENKMYYAAAAVLSWARRFSWTADSEERFSYLRGEALYRLGFYEEARPVFEEFLDARKEIPVSSFADRRLVSAAAYRLGDLEMRSGRYREAVEKYSRAFVEGPKVRKFSFEGNWIPEDIKMFVHVLFNRAEAFVRLGQEESALRDLRAFLFVSPSDKNVGLVYYRIGDLLNTLGAPEDKVLGAWRECAFKVPATLGGRLCAARKSAKEILRFEPAKWPRLIADVEDALKVKPSDTDGLSQVELASYLNLVLADVFIQRNHPYQALLRLEMSQNADVSPYLRMWLREYTIVSLAGYGSRLVTERKYKEVVNDYERRRKTLFLHETRHEVLANVVKAYDGMDLFPQALTTLDAAERVRDKIARPVPRPYDLSPEEWAYLRASIETEVLASHKEPIDPQHIRQSLGALDASKPENQRLWIHFLQVIKAPAEEEKWWRKLEGSTALTWEEVRQYSNLLDRLKMNRERKDFYERRIGSWFGEREKIGGVKAPPTELVMELFEMRAASGEREKALALGEYMADLPDDKLGPTVTKPMVAYKRGVILRELGRTADARASFGMAKQLAPDTIWGKLAAAADKELTP